MVGERIVMTTAWIPGPYPSEHRGPAVPWLSWWEVFVSLEARCRYKLMTAAVGSSQRVAGPAVCPLWSLWVVTRAQGPAWSREP